MSKKKENKWYKAGNYLLGEEKNQSGKYIVCRSVDGGWQIRFREDMYMYAMLFGLIKDNDAQKIVNLMTFWYWNTAMVHSAEYYTDTMKRLGEEMEKIQAAELPKEEDDKILQDTVEMETLKEQIEELDGKEESNADTQ